MRTEALILAQKRYYLKKKEKILTKNKEYREANKDKIKKITKAYRDSLEGKIKDNEAKKRYQKTEKGKETLFSQRLKK